MEVHKIAIEKDMQKARDDLQKDIELLTQDVTNAIRQAITYIRRGKTSYKYTLRGELQSYESHVPGIMESLIPPNYTSRVYTIYNRKHMQRWWMIEISIKNERCVIM